MRGFPSLNMDVARALNAIGGAIYLKDIDASIVYANDDMLELMGYPADRVLGRAERDLLGNDISELMADGAARLIAGLQREVRAEYSVSDAAEMLHLLDVRQRLYESAAGEVLVMVMLRDVTEERRLEEVLKGSEEYSRSFLESSQDCIAHLSSEGSFLSMNDAGAAMLGLGSAEEMIGHGFDMLCSNEGEICSTALLQAVGGEQVRFEQRVRRAGCGERWLDIHLTPIKDIDDSVRNILLVGRDVTDLKMLQSQLLQQEKMSSIGQLAAGVAHEINNPMGFVMSNLNTLRKYVDRLQGFIAMQQTALQDVVDMPSSAVENLNKVNAGRMGMKIDFVLADTINLLAESLDGAERVKRIVQDLKGFSRIDEAESKMADINAGLESTINIAWNEIKYKATVRKEFGDIPQTKCNPGQLNQVFMNILINAAQAIQDTGEIRIMTWAGQGAISVAISDTGSGIPPEKVGRIFEPFYTTKDVGKGTGLGLSIAYDIVKKHAGEITVQSELGKGTTFTVSIPVVEG